MFISNRYCSDCCFSVAKVAMSGNPKSTSQKWICSSQSRTLVGWLLLVSNLVGMFNRANNTDRFDCLSAGESQRRSTNLPRSV